MIKYYGTPITPKSVFKYVFENKERNVLIPFTQKQDFNKSLKYAKKIIIDNGAFTIWKRGGIIKWDDYYEWIYEIFEYIEFFLIPDVIDGTEIENDKLIKDYFSRNISKGVPIWHINESIERLEELISKFDYIAFGSAGEYSTLGTLEWNKKMNEAMMVCCDKNGIPIVKIHMLRCLNPKIFTKYPFYSGDSTNLARNHKRDGVDNILSRIEKYNSPKKYYFKKYYKTKSLF